MIRLTLLSVAALAFAALSAGFGAVAVDLLTADPAPRQSAGGQTPAPAPAPEGAARPVFIPPALDDFADILDRPLFEPDRQPPEIYEEEEPDELEVVVEAPPPPPEEEFIELDALLRGVVTSAAGGFILLEPGDGGPMVRLSLGEAHDGWRLTRLDGRSAEFEKGDERTTLSLSYRGDE